MKPDYKNRVPKSMVYGLASGTVIAFPAFMLSCVTGMIFHGTQKETGNNNAFHVCRMRERFSG